MARVEVVVNGRGYMVACEDGQEGRIRELAGVVDETLREIAGDRPSGSEPQLLLVTSLVLADRLQELQAEVQALRGARLGLAPAAPIQVPARGAAEDEAVVSAVDTLAKRIEDIAARLDRA
ncbi:cell division protein ZapA [Aerophototrophica crusticola]|uniref:Cell division protein ZapA n=1 Tax=Aerophototrophica crusticola TaxID=1709002 RepID=A0A858R7I6_9PROT|nr:cell division protein ZapA [Rhodospirillaceae bacterium B3]